MTRTPVVTDTVCSWTVSRNKDLPKLNYLLDHCASQVPVARRPDHAVPKGYSASHLSSPGPRMPGQKMCALRALCRLAQARQGGTPGRRPWLISSLGWVTVGWNLEAFCAPQALPVRGSAARLRPMNKHPVFAVPSIVCSFRGASGALSSCEAAAQHCLRLARTAASSCIWAPL